jgi:hypothetical protein
METKDEEHQAGEFKALYENMRELQYIILSEIGFLKIQKWLGLKPVSWIQDRIDRDKSKNEKVSKLKDNKEYGYR